MRHAADPANKRKTPLLRTDIPGRTDQVMNPLGEDGERIIANANGAPPLDWWEVTTKPYKGAHYATWPSALITKPIASMCPERVCTTCGEPSRRLVEADEETCQANREKTGFAARDNRETGGYTGGFASPDNETVGWSDVAITPGATGWFWTASLERDHSGGGHRTRS